MELLTRLLFLLMTLISWSVCQDQKIITTHPGQNVVLPCKGLENNPVTTVKLTRADLNPEYVLVYRDDKMYEQIQNPCFKGRTELQGISSSDGNVNVILHNVTEGDRGTYKCFVKFDTDGAKTRRKRATSERTIQLRVLSPGRGHLGVVVGVPLAVLVVLAVAVLTLAAGSVWKKKESLPPHCSLNEAGETLGV